MDAFITIVQKIVCLLGLSNLSSHLIILLRFYHKNSLKGMTSWNLKSSLSFISYLIVRNRHVTFPYSDQKTHDHWDWSFSEVLLLKHHIQTEVSFLLKVPNWWPGHARFLMLLSNLYVETFRYMKTFGNKDFQKTKWPNLLTISFHTILENSISLHLV